MSWQEARLRRRSIMRRGPSLRGLWQAPAFVLGVGALAAAVLLRPLFGAGEAASPLKRDLAEARRLLEHDGDAEQAAKLAQHVLDAKDQHPELAGQADLLLGTARMRQATGATADQAAPLWAEARKRLEAAEKETIPESEKARLQFRLGVVGFYTRRHSPLAAAPGGAGSRHHPDHDHDRPGRRSRFGVHGADPGVSAIHPAEPGERPGDQPQAAQPAAGQGRGAGPGPVAGRRAGAAHGPFRGGPPRSGQPRPAGDAGVASESQTAGAPKASRPSPAGPTPPTCGRRRWRTASRPARRSTTSACAPGARTRTSMRPATGRSACRPAATRGGRPLWPWPRCASRGRIPKPPWRCSRGSWTASSPATTGPAS